MRKKSQIITIVKKCEKCTKEFSYDISINNHTINKRFCSKICACSYNHEHMSEETKKNRLIKIKKTNFEKYGDEWVINSEYSRQKTFDKLGVKYPLQDIQIFEKTKKSLIKKTGYRYPAQNPETLKQILKTKIERYGDYLIPMSKYKNYTMPSGKIIKIQGNENYALNILLLKYSEADIIVGRKNIENEIGKIYYAGKDNKQHIYYPDIYIKSENKIYEVKSNFTYNLHKEINELKRTAVLKSNILFEFMII